MLLFLFSGVWPFKSLFAQQIYTIEKTIVFFKAIFNQNISNILPLLLNEPEHNIHRYIAP